MSPSKKTTGRKQSEIGSDERMDHEPRRTNDEAARIEERKREILKEERKQEEKRKK